MENQVLYVSWLGLDTSIGVIIEDKPDFWDQFPYCVITCIDSSVELRKLSTIKRVVHDFERECKFIGEGLQISGMRIPELMRNYNLFNGFDNIWCFEVEPFVPPKRDLSLVGPMGVGGKYAEDIDNIKELKELMEAFKQENIHLKEWMVSSGCVLGLGDGCGLTYATVSEKLADELEKNWGNR